MGTGAPSSPVGDEPLPPRFDAWAEYNQAKEEEQAEKEARTAEQKGADEVRCISQSDVSCSSTQLPLCRNGHATTVRGKVVCLTALTRILWLFESVRTGLA